VINVYSPLTHPHLALKERRRKRMNERNHFPVSPPTSSFSLSSSSLFSM
jgi:hypothetical protein